MPTSWGVRAAGALRNRASKGFRSQQQCLTLPAAAAAARGGGGRCAEQHVRQAQGTSRVLYVFLRYMHMGNASPRQRLLQLHCAAAAAGARAARAAGAPGRCCRPASASPPARPLRPQIAPARCPWTCASSCAHARSFSSPDDGAMLSMHLIRSTLSTLSVQAPCQLGGRACPQTDPLAHHNTMRPSALITHCSQHAHSLGVLKQSRVPDASRGGLPKAQ